MLAPLGSSSLSNRDERKQNKRLAVKGCSGLNLGFSPGEAALSYLNGLVRDPSRPQKPQITTPCRSVVIACQRIVPRRTWFTQRVAAVRVVKPCDQHKYLPLRLQQVWVPRAVSAAKITLTIMQGE